jgi:hypothetical protein
LGLLAIGRLTGFEAGGLVEVVGLLAADFETIGFGLAGW